MHPVVQEIPQQQRQQETSGALPKISVEVWVGSQPLDGSHVFRPQLKCAVIKRELNVYGQGWLIDREGYIVPEDTEVPAGNYKFDVPVQGQGTSASGAGHDTSSAIIDMTQVVRQLAEVILVRETIHPALSYSSGKITTIRDPDFRFSVLKAYGYRKEECSGRSSTIPCLILDRDVPSSSLAVGHIFKHEWAAVSQRVMGIDINDPGNGLPLFKPLEDAFDHLQLCITQEQDDTFIVRVLYPGLKPVKLVQRAKELNVWPSGYHNAGLESMTFQDLDGQVIKFYSNHRPYERCLSFQAKQAYMKAHAKGWVEASLEFREFATPPYPGASRAFVKQWLQNDVPQSG